MKKFYTAFLSLFFLFGQGRAQCINGNPSNTTAYDTTVKFPSGVTHKQIKFPKFNAQSGMLTCVKLVVTMTAIIDTTSFENLLSSPFTVSRTYDRSDAMTGPGLTPSLNNSYNRTQNFALGPNDNVPNSGSDFYSYGKDTIMRQQMMRTLTDSTAISAFYGTDSVVYDYDINAVTNVSGSGDIATYMRTSTFVNFRFEYCNCPLATLPVGLKNFSVTKTGNTNAALRWEAEPGSDHYYYEVEVSGDGSNFIKAGLLNKQTVSGSHVYNYGYSVKLNEYGRHYFRVKQQWLDGYFRYSDVRVVDFTNPVFSTVSLYPNPSSGAVGLKFVAAKAGLYGVKISNAAGQVVVSKELQVAETDFKQLALLQKGTYYVKVTESLSGATSVQQLVVQ